VGQASHHHGRINPRKKQNTKMGTNKNNYEGFIPIHGGYRNLITYQKSEVIYDGTMYFTKRFF